MRTGNRVDFIAENSSITGRRGFLRDVGLTGTAAMASSWLNGNGTTAFANLNITDGMIVHTDSPRNSEPPLDRLVESWMTPVDAFYVRSHAPNPEIDRSSFRLTVEGLVENQLSISLAELNDLFDETSVVATMTCAGNRRTEHSLIKPVSGVPWQAGAIGNARWTGVPLSAVLRKAGLKENAKHVWFEGLDEIPKGDGIIPFGASIPVSKAMLDQDGFPGALLTTRMNGEPLNADHGAPLRAVVPGYIGARSVKWLGKIVVSDRPSPNHYVATAYKLVQEGTPLEWDESGPIYRFPLNSVICTPASEQSVQAGRIPVAGYALPSGRPGVTIDRVEVSTDRGHTWTQAKIHSPLRQYCWVLWKADVEVTSDTSELMVRAIDSSGATQPGSAKWNLKGYMFNAWHRITTRIT